MIASPQLPAVDLPAELQYKEIPATPKPYLRVEPHRPARPDTGTLRCFLIAKFGLAGPGLTADEIAAHLPTDESLAAELHLFLHHCDIANFAPAAPAPSGDAVIDDALGLLDAVERQMSAPLPV